ncbi:DUF7373 family lipoprotein [Nocardia transvalensis]|uniref:DUF7373 family lipoprotein n=1 Tax=Nocardia transvalensis TaxID=37333 RepID=UPI0018945AB7|nr:hypothetical protein [Nocardia transvalensis]MBF6327464.1 hypothetical protein [Nocardia transvalensis]
MKGIRAPRVVVACVAAAGLLAGCAVQGTPHAAELDVRTLDVGPYAVDRHRYDQRANGKGALLEGMRMSQAVVPAVRIDPSLRVGQGGRVVRDSDDATRKLLAGVSKPVLDNRKMLVGYAAGGTDRDYSAGAPPVPDATAVTNMLLRFPDADTARTAARELEDVDFGVAPDLNRKLTLSKYPDAHIHYRPGVPTIGTFMAYREFVISLFIERPRAEEPDLLAWVKKTLDAQVPALDRFQPTPQDRIDELPVDPDGLLARAVVRDRADQTPDPDRFAVYAPPAFVHIATDEAERQRLIDDTGLDALAVAENSSVVRVRDADAGQRLITGLMAGAGQGYEPTDGPKNVPGAKCLQFTSSGDPARETKFRCYIPYKRYVEVITAQERTDALQRSAAAYALLANSL